MGRFPRLHIYHFSPYEPAALKRLMGRYATREDELDRMLRAELFLDLHAVVRQAMRASVERYTLKNLEAFYGFERSVPLREASLHLRTFERALELGRLDGFPDRPAQLSRVQSGRLPLPGGLPRLAEQLRAELIGAAHIIPRTGDPNPRTERSPRRAPTARLRSSTRDWPGTPGERSERTEEEQGRWLLANMLDWHRREQKASWWEYFRLCALPDED